LGANQAGVVSVPVKLRVNDTPDIDQQVRLYGPGDVTGMDPQQVVRTVPCHLALDFEPNYFPAIEFDRPDFPWLFTPAKANAERLRPWLCLVVVRKQEGVALLTGGALPVLEIKAPALPEHELPDLSESWAWAHTQVTGSLLDRDVLKTALAGDPALNLSRLLCPRRLDPETEYLACVVPAFELGRKAGLGDQILPADEEKLKPAWTLGEQPPLDDVKLPVYYHWEFRTGTGVDFETLARSLKARDMPPQVGKRPIDISQPGFPVASQGTTLELEGALRVPNSSTAVWPEETRVPFQAELKEILDEPWQMMKEQPKAIPLLAPPIYGCWQGARHTVEVIPEPLPVSPPSRLWLHQLNLDPRHRAVAALGTKVVQAEQEQLMASAWEQLGNIERINQTLRQAQLGRAVNMVYYTNVFSRLSELSEEAFFNIVAPAQSRLVLTETEANQPLATPPVKTLLVRSIAGSSLPSSAVSAPIRRLSSPRGAINRRSLRTGANGVAGMFKLFKSGPAPSSQQLPDKGAVTIDKVSQGVRNVVSSSGGFVWNPDPPPHQELATPILMQMLDLFQLAHISSDAVSSSPPATTGMSPELTAALRSHQNYLSQAFFSSPIFRPRPALDVKNAALASLNPARTIEARVKKSLIITGDAGQAGDALAPLMDAPEFPQPMYEALRDLSQDHLFPGLEHVLPDTVMLLETNPKFVESFLVGLNSEMASELLWRNYPTDQRGTYFRQFWDTSGGDGGRDIEKISQWGDRPLGKNALGSDNLVLLLKGELLRRYPNSVIYAVKAEAEKPGGQLKLSSKTEDEHHPLFRGTLKPDVTFLGFDLTREDAKADPGYFFVIQQQPTEPRFGLDVADFSGLLPLLTGPTATWDDLSWRHFANTEEELKALSHASTKTVLPAIGGVEWGKKTSAHQAFITLQRPVRIAIHAKEMIRGG
jgi:hypothetical protein